MRLSSIALAVTLVAACSKKESATTTSPEPIVGSASTPKPIEPPPPVVKKPLDTTPLPELKPDKGGATGNATWATGFGGLGVDSARDIARSKSGDIYVVGYFDGEMAVGANKFKATDPEPSTDPKKPTIVTSDAFVTKLGPDGKPGWTRTWGAKRDDDAKGVAVQGDTVVVVGNFLDEIAVGSLKNPAAGSDDIYAVAFDKTGDPLWLFTAGGVDSDGANAVAAAPDGGWYIGGSFRKLATFGQGKHQVDLQSKGGTDAMLIKLSAGGDLEWVKQFGGPYDDTILHLAVDAQGSVYVQGHFKNTSDWGGKPLVAAGGSDNDVVLAKYDSNGDPMWSKRFGNAFNDVAGGLTVDPAGNITMVGSFDKSVSFGEGDEHQSKGEADIFIARFDGAGKLDWAHTYGSDREDVGWGIAADSAGNTIMTGWFQNKVDFGKTTLAPIQSRGNKDVLAIKHDIKGNIVWVKTWGDKDHDQGRGVVIDDKGGAIITGLYRFTLGIVNPPLESVHAPDDRIPKPDAFVLRLDR